VEIEYSGCGNPHPMQYHVDAPVIDLTVCRISRPVNLERRIHVILVSRSILNGRGSCVVLFVGLRNILGQILPGSY
jgi:hypothetical protein